MVPFLRFCFVHYITIVYDGDSIVRNNMTHCMSTEHHVENIYLNPRSISLAFSQTLFFHQSLPSTLTYLILLNFSCLRMQCLTLLLTDYSQTIVTFYPVLLLTFHDI